MIPAKRFAAACKQHARRAAEGRLLGEVVNVVYDRIVRIRDVG